MPVDLGRPTQLTDHFHRAGGSFTQKMRLASHNFRPMTGNPDAIPQSAWGSLT